MTQDSSPPPSAIQRVPVGRTMRAAYAAVFGSLGLLVKAAILPFLLSLVVLALALMAGANAFLSFVLAIVGLVPYTLFGVAWHRLTLLGPAAGAPVVFPSWHRRHWRFIGYVMSMIGLSFLLTYFISVAGSGMVDDDAPGRVLLLILAVIAVGLALSYMMMRVSFVFPAVAVDEDYGLANSWAHTRGQGFRLLATLFVTALPMLVAIWAVSSLLGVLLLPEIAASDPESGMSPEEALRQALRNNAASFALAQLVLAALNYIFAALMVSVVSISFRLCTGWVPAAGTGPPATRDIEDDNGAES